jgi:hypothetical protein
MTPIIVSTLLFEKYTIKPPMSGNNSVIMELIIRKKPEKILSSY